MGAAGLILLRSPHPYTSLPSVGLGLLVFGCFGLIHKVIDHTLDVIVALSPCQIHGEVLPKLFSLPPFFVVDPSLKLLIP